MLPPPSIAARLDDARARIAAAEAAAGRPAGSVTLTVVTKTQTPEAVAEVIAAGAGVFGENRVQEAQARWGARPRPRELRLIGPLQSNKARAACDLFDVIETLDRDSLLDALAAEAQKRGRSPRLLVQVNTGQEPQKAGVAPAAADALIARARAADLPVEGLMCIPPAGEAPTPHFNILARIAADQGLAILSMGMSEDFEAAIAAGATHVRLGSALFGRRPAPGR